MKKIFDFSKVRIISFCFFSSLIKLSFKNNSNSDLQFVLILNLSLNVVEFPISISLIQNFFNSLSVLDSNVIDEFPKSKVVSVKPKT